MEFVQLRQGFPFGRRGGMGPNNPQALRGIQGRSSETKDLRAGYRLHRPGNASPPGRSSRRRAAMMVSSGASWEGADILAADDSSVKRVVELRADIHWPAFVCRHRVRDGTTHQGAGRAGGAAEPHRPVLREMGPEPDRSVDMLVQLVHHRLIGVDAGKSAQRVRP